MNSRQYKFAANRIKKLAMAIIICTDHIESADIDPLLKQTSAEMRDIHIRELARYTQRLKERARV